MKWTEDRVAEYELLVELVYLANGLNHGNNIVDKIKRLEEISTILTTTNWEKARADFIQFLKDRIVEDRKEGKL